jgi:hypothetical protein
MSKVESARAASSGERLPYVEDYQFDGLKVGEFFTVRLPRDKKQRDKIEREIGMNTADYMMRKAKMSIHHAEKQNAKKKFVPERTRSGINVWRCR